MKYDENLWFTLKNCQGKHYFNTLGINVNEYT